MFFTSGGRGVGILDSLSSLPRPGCAETDTGANQYQLATEADNHSADTIKREETKQHLHDIFHAPIFEHTRTPRR